MGNVAVFKKDAEKAINILREKNLLEYNKKIKREKNEVIIPVKNVKLAIKILSQHQIKATFSLIEPENKNIITRKEIREKALKEGVKPWSSYNMIGDILLINIKDMNEIDDARKYATYLLELFPRLKSAYAKLSTEGQHRTPSLIHLTGEEKTYTITKEYGIKIAVDIKKAYYNPRLSEEHYRISQLVNDGEMILDLFSGVGGFTLHIGTKKKTYILANDHNPHAIKLLLESIILNKKKMKSRIFTTVSDAGELLVNLSNKIKFDRIIMNNPTMVNKFLPNLEGVIGSNTIIHLYVLLNKQEKNNYLSHVKNYFKKKIIINEPIPVIDYSPSKHIYRIDIRVVT